MTPVLWSKGSQNYVFCFFFIIIIFVFVFSFVISFFCDSKLFSSFCVYIFTFYPWVSFSFIKKIVSQVKIKPCPGKKNKLFAVIFFIIIII